MFKVGENIRVENVFNNFSQDACEGNGVVV